jgi:conjugal transfer pilin signal peptidase TrbI
MTGTDPQEATRLSRTPSWSASSQRTSGWRLLLLGLPLVVLVWATVAGLLGRFQLALDVQERPCLPGHRLYLVDRAQHDVRRGEIIVFRSDEQTPLEPPGAWIAKLVIGLPGDHVRVTPETVEVNGIVVGQGLLLADKVGMPPAALTRDLVVPPGHVWAMGETADSYDSRYYGPAPLWKMRGTAVAVF